MPGRIVLLNGPSSSGKTTLSAALVAELDTPCLEVPVDLFHAVRSRPDLRGVEDIAWEDVFRATRAGYHRAIAGLAHVTCSREELVERESRRGDRDPGTALAQLATVFAHDDSDLTVDTSSAPVADCARAVTDLLAAPHRSRAFDRLRAARTA